MRAIDAAFDGRAGHVSRSGYTGEDGFEISVPLTMRNGLRGRLLAHADVKPIGLGARDTLRLEAGLPLYGHDLDETTSPVEAGLSFTIGKRRRQLGGFPGAERILQSLRKARRGCASASARRGARRCARAPRCCRQAASASAR